MTYHHLLEAFEGARSCGLCTLEQRAMSRYFESILYESVTDPAVRADLRRAHGYCTTHALYLVGLRSAFDTALLYQDEIGDLIDVLGGLGDSPPAGTKSGRSHKEELPGEWLRHSHCPACRIQKETRQHYLEAFAEALEEQRMRRAFSSSSGMCLPHLRLFLKERLKGDVRRLVLDREKESLAGLQNELKELCRKFDYRFSKEQVGEERDSWRRAVLLINGSPLSFPDGLNGSYWSLSS